MAKTAKTTEPWWTYFENDACEMGLTFAKSCRTFDEFWRRAPYASWLSWVIDRYLLTQRDALALSIGPLSRVRHTIVCCGLELTYLIGDEQSEWMGKWMDHEMQPIFDALWQEAWALLTRRPRTCYAELTPINRMAFDCYRYTSSPESAVFYALHQSIDCARYTYRFDGLVDTVGFTLTRNGAHVDASNAAMLSIIRHYYPRPPDFRTSSNRDAPHPTRSR